MPDGTSFIASFADPLGSFKVGRSQILLSTQCSCHQEGCPEDQCPHRQEQAPVPPESDGSDNPIHHRSRERQQDYVSSRRGRGARLHQDPPRIIATTRFSVSSKPGDQHDAESSVRDAPVVGARIRRDALYEPTPRMSGRMTGVHTFSDGLDWGPVPGHQLWTSHMTPASRSSASARIPEPRNTPQAMSRHSRLEISSADLRRRGMPAHFHHGGSSSLIGTWGRTQPNHGDRLTRPR